MYSYEEFLTQVRLGLEKSLNKQYDKVDVQEVKVQKINCEMIGLTCNIGGDKNTICPTIYLETLYENYMELEDLDEILRRVEQILVKTLDERDDLKEKVKGISESTDRIIFQLINTEQNKELLKTLPHRSFFNLSIIYRCVLETEGNEIMSAPINHALADLMNLNEEQLYQFAYENTKAMLEPTIVPMHEVIQSLLRDVAPDEPLFDENVEGRIPLYVITNKIREWGAASVLYLDDLQAFADELESNLYLLPSSIHDMIAIAVENGDPEELMNLVYEVNQGLPVEERLSNDVYLYDRDQNKLIQVTESEHKMLVEETNERVERDEMDEGSTSMRMGM